MGDPGQGEVTMHCFITDYCTPVLLQVKHQYSDWREPSIDRKLHFAAPVKAVIAGQLVAVFEGLDQEGIIC